MPSFNQVLSVATLAGLAVAAPAPAVQPKHQFTVPQKVVNHGTLPYGQHLNLATYHKFGKVAPDNVKAAAAAVTGRVAADPSDDYDSSYLSPVTVGGKVLNLDFDTGSSDLWVFSSLQPASQRTGHAYYTANAAKKVSGAKWSISYGDGSGAAGSVYKDTVTIGGVTYSSQAVEAATSISAQFQQDTDTDGLVGLAFSSINTVTPTQQKTFFDNVQSSLASPIVVANLKYHAAGEYDFGFTDSSKYTGSLSYTNVDNSEGFWGITVSGYGTTTTLTSTRTSAIADTGTTLIYLPDAVIKAYYAKVKGAKIDNTQGGYVFPCSATLPDLYLKVGNFVSRTPGNYINYAPLEDGSSTCFGGVQSSADVGISILGDIWLKAQYVVFDISVPRLGLAAKPL